MSRIPEILRARSGFSSATLSVRSEKKNPKLRKVWNWQFVVQIRTTIRSCLYTVRSIAYKSESLFRFGLISPFCVQCTRPDSFFLHIGIVCFDVKIVIGIVRTKLLTSGKASDFTSIELTANLVRSDKSLRY